MPINELPSKIARADTDGINNVIDALVVDAASAKELAAMLKEDPVGVIRRTLHLNRYQRAGLAEMTKAEIAGLTAPVVKVLTGKDYARLRGFRLVETITRQSPVRIRCQIEIDW